MPMYRQGYVSVTGALYQGHLSLSSCSNKGVWTAMVRTQDLTPPVLTVVDTPPPDFDKFSVVVQLDEPGTIYGGLLLATNQAQVSATVACEPVFTVSSAVVIFKRHLLSCAAEYQQKGQHSTCYCKALCWLCAFIQRFLQAVLP